MDKVKLHTCSWTFLHMKADACWRLQRELDEAGIPYEAVKHGYTKKRAKVEEISGQKLFPVIEFADGKVYREETDAMIATVKAGTLAQKDV